MKTLPAYWLMPDIHFRKNKQLQVKQFVCEELGINPNEIITKKRTTKIVNARYIASAIYKQYFDMKLIDIAKQFDKYEHTTIVNSLQKHKDFMSVDENYRKSFEAIKKRLEL